jgi:hypothetical protein
VSLLRILVEAVRLAREVGGLIGIAREAEKDEALQATAAGRAADDAAKQAGPK